jgi:hypothetical protein
MGSLLLGNRRVNRNGEQGSDGKWAQCTGLVPHVKQKRQQNQKVSCFSAIPLKR